MTHDWQKNLAQLGYALDTKVQIWRRPDYQGIAYNDGDEVETRIANAIAGVQDISVLSPELRQHCIDWASLYHLTSDRANLMRPFAHVFASGASVLEVGAGCGAITRYMGECGANVLALEGSPRRAAIARSRTRDLVNVTVLSERFSDFAPPADALFDVITLIGVLEYANLFTQSSNPHLSMLQRVRQLLKPEGVLIIAIENQLGLKYFAGAPEDHLGQPMYGIEGRYQDNQPQTFGLGVMKALLQDAGFVQNQFMSPLPDYKLPTSIITESGFASPQFDSSALAWQSARKDPQLPALTNFSLEQAWPEIDKNGLELDLANSFLIAAKSKPGQQTVDTSILAFHYSTGRLPKYCKQTRFVKQNDTITLQVSRMVAPYTGMVEGDLMNQYVEAEQAYIRGTLLSRRFIKLVSQDGWTQEQLQDYLQTWLGIVQKQAKCFGANLNLAQATINTLLPGECIDCIAQNFILRDNHVPELIDKEWISALPVKLGHLIFRQLLLLLNSVSRFGACANQHPMSRQDFVRQAYQILSLEVNDQNLADYNLQESIIQQSVTGISYERFIDWKPQSHINNHLALQNLENDIETSKQELEEKQREIEELRHLLQLMEGSRSWRSTAPLRKLRGATRSFLRTVKQTKCAAYEVGGYSNLLKKSAEIVRREGVRGFVKKTREIQQLPSLFKTASGEFVSRNDYQTWIKIYDTLNENDVQRIRQEIEQFEDKPKISIVMPVYNPPLKFLIEAIESVLNQVYDNWELCIADDASTNKDIRPLLESYARKDERIKVVFREENGHISAASNSALELATGDFVALFDNDDLLPMHALYCVTKAILENPDVALLYSDEDKINEGGFRYDPYFKCDLNYELLLAQNMICHLGVYRRDLLGKIGGFRLGFEGAQDYDLVLRLLEQIKPDEVVHVPKVLYHWRAFPGSTALDAGEKNYAAEAARKAIAEHLERTGRGGTVMPSPDVPSLNRVRYALPYEPPLVSIIIPTRDRSDILKVCLESVLEKTAYNNYEIIIVDNGSVEEETNDLFSKQPQDKVRIVQDDSPFNYSRLNNFAVEQSHGDVICLMNNDIEVITHDWLEEMLSFAMQSDVGCVGARLWYPDGRLQHGGVILGIGGVAGHAHKYISKGQCGYFGRAVLHQALSAVTAACLVIRRSVWQEVKGLDESFAVAFNDIDFCLRVSEMGYRNVWTPYAEMIHHESVSRGHEDNPEKIARFNAEAQRMRDRWGVSLHNDFAYSRNLTLDHEDFSLAWPSRVN